MKIVIAERNWLVRVGLAQAITNLVAGPDIFTAADAGELHRVLVEHTDMGFVLVEDAILSNREEEHFAHVRKLAPDAAIGVLVGTTDRPRVLKAIYFGAVAIIQTDASEDIVLGALRSLFDGQVAFPRDLLAEGPQRPVSSPADSAHDDHRLTPREREVIGHIGAGKTVARIAAELNLSPHTVRVHVTRIMKKLDLHDRSSLIHYAVKRSGSAARRSPPRNPS